MPRHRCCVSLVGRIEGEAEYLVLANDSADVVSTAEVRIAVRMKSSDALKPGSHSLLPSRSSVIRP